MGANGWKDVEAKSATYYQTDADNTSVMAYLLRLTAPAVISAF